MILTTMIHCQSFHFPAGKYLGKKMPEQTVEGDHNLCPGRSGSGMGTTVCNCDCHRVKADAERQRRQEEADRLEALHQSMGQAIG